MRMTPQETFDHYRRDPEHDTWHHLPFFREVACGYVLEIGVCRGASTSAFLLGVEARGGRVYSVDIDPVCVRCFEGHPLWKFIAADSKDEAAVKSQVPCIVDVLFIDGEHTREAVASDLKNYAPLVRNGGLILVHDILEPDRPYPWGWHPGVGQAVNEFIAQHGYALRIKPHSWGLGVIQVG